MRNCLLGFWGEVWVLCRRNSLIWKISYLVDLKVCEYGKYVVKGVWGWEGVVIC